MVLVADDYAPSRREAAKGFAIANVGKSDVAPIGHGDGEGAVVVFRGFSGFDGDVVGDGLVVLVVQVAYGVVCLCGCGQGEQTDQG